MNAPQQIPDISAIEAQMTKTLEAQRQDYLQEGKVTAERRIDRLDRGIDALIRYQDKIADALNTDFTCRPREVSLITDVAGSIGTMKHSRKHLRKWMKPEKRPTIFPLNLLGGRSHIEYQPLGVVGIIAPWNFPVSMVFQPMAGALAAGNRVLVKPSEFTPATSEVIAELIGDAYDAKEVTTFTGGPEVGQAFSGLPFDHLLFTGATSIARHIMAAAARNLVPVTLELGGKSPVIISRTADIEKSLSRIMMGKTLNAGQICLAPDYLLVPEEKLDEVIAAAQQAVSTMYPRLLDNPQYTSVVNERHYQRLNGYLAEAQERGATIIPVNPASEDFQHQQGTYKIPPTLIPQPPEDSKLLEEEIFGPLLPIIGYSDLAQALETIRQHERPLALYLLTFDKRIEQQVILETHAGGMCVNDTVAHVAIDDLPFGGIGPSGIGQYHAHEGFKTFSKAKPILKRGKLYSTKWAFPPYPNWLHRLIYKRFL